MQSWLLAGDRRGAWRERRATRRRRIARAPVRALRARSDHRPTDRRRSSRATRLSDAVERRDRDRIRRHDGGFRSGIREFDSFRQGGPLQNGGVMKLMHRSRRRLAIERRRRVRDEALAEPPQLEKVLILLIPYQESARGSLFQKLPAASSVRFLQNRRLTFVIDGLKNELQVMRPGD